MIKESESEPESSTSESESDSNSRVDVGNENIVEHDSQHINDSPMKQIATVTAETPTNVSYVYIEGNHINILDSPSC